MQDKPTSTNDINTNGCRYKYQVLGTNEYGCYAESEKGVCITLCKDIPLKSCYYRQLKQSEQKAQDTYDMFKACMQSLEIARKQLSDEQQKVYRIHQIYKKYSANYITNAGIKLMNELADIANDYNRVEKTRNSIEME